MTVRKQYPPRNYETFPEEGASESQTSSGSDKSRTAAAEAQRLGSLGSWADNFAGETPATNRTPTASTVDGDEVRNVQYPQLSQEPDPSDPPPVYTPSDTTASRPPTEPASPVAQRSVPAQPETVSPPITVTSSSTPYAQRPFRDDDGTDLPEPVQHPHHSCHHHQNRHDQSDTESDNVPAFLQSSNTWARGRRWWRRRHEGRSRGCGGRRWGRRRDCHKERARRFKKICWFTFALLLCLWLMIPGLCKSLSKDDRKQFPILAPHPSGSPWPPFPKREHREHETFRSISGTYQLYDLLDLSTASGSISVNIEVQSGEKPAHLRLSSTAGSVHVKMTSGGGLFRKASVPEVASKRTLITEITAHAGSVSGDLVHGNGGSTTVSTHAGSVSLTLYTNGVSDEDPVSNISTSTWQGSQNIKVLAPFTSTEAVRAIVGSHVIQGSGSMNIQYPPEWEGLVHIKAMGMGSIGASGQGLNVQKESSKELYGYRGMKEGRRIEVLEGGSGSVQFRC
ncbi:hypothetical protein LTR99_007636 [Exophiala xenobiotica]|uniref:Adhesin domain-containing protein n=1 Tax=Vermiconidia calcicola TaxID=1690605 RepID=A0AAV9Q495_9PEZI|nr:hypothetical protein LTR47_002261 [Exophiala xenobiotica]KAK5535393.1 hypothetical protein LTR25_006401 [Vermiconidia calcicola]KAK5546894.1 hypothetical protein LTR23_003265 [Chaetothyriales sp. CCFEE 6169]KAK5248837.1 hypothetical protein LTS06_006136 [Exophiala xenobiotica]KAK5273794.1 hypothetical protein LTR96_000394 [Exophiala xenobiotica]